jgi:hypothetical protein
MHERLGRPAIRGDWQWVSPWLESRAASIGTRDAYMARWRNVTGWLAESDLTSPASIRREHAQQYLAWRKELRASKNTALYEVKLLAMVMGEAVNREMVARNPLTNLRISKDQEKEREPFTEEQLAKLDSIFNAGAHRYTFKGEHLVERFGWLHTSFLLGKWQAVRLRQSGAPLSVVDLERNVFRWPASIMKQRRDHVQPIRKGFQEALRELVRHRQDAGKTTLADLPELPSLHWRAFLDSLSMTNVSHHSLRSFVITRMAVSGVPESACMKWVGHSSQAIHRVYQRFSTDDLAAMVDRLG